MSTMDPTRAANPPENAGGPAAEVAEPATRAGGAGVLLLHATSGDAGETARRILAAASGGLWPVLEHARSAVLIVARAFGQLAIDTALVDTVTLRADSEVAVAQGLMIRACTYPSLVAAVATRHPR